jgi:RNA polymerase sigma-70 factor (ECF subfamily)
LTFIKNIPVSHTDAELVALYKQSGEQEVLARLYQRYMDLIYGVCLKYFKNSEDAHDAVIHIYEELITKVKKHDVEYFRAWLYQLAKNHCLMALRKKKINFLSADDDFVQLPDLSHPEQVHENEVQFQVMQYCMEQLADQQKKAIELFYLREQCYKDIALETGWEVGMVKSHIQNGRRNLKNCMTEKMKIN